MAKQKKPTIELTEEQEEILSNALVAYGTRAREQARKQIVADAKNKDIGSDDLQYPTGTIMVAEQLENEFGTTLSALAPVLTITRPKG